MAELVKAKESHRCIHLNYLLFLAQMLRDCSCSNEVKEHIRKRIDKLGLDGYQCIAVGRIVNSRLDIISLLPFIDDLRSDSAEAVDNLTDMGLSVIVLTGDVSHVELNFHVIFHLHFI